MAHQSPEPTQDEEEDFLDGLVVVDEWDDEHQNKKETKTNSTKEKQRKSLDRSSNVRHNREKLKSRRPSIERYQCKSQKVFKNLEWNIADNVKFKWTKSSDEKVLNKYKETTNNETDFGKYPTQNASYRTKKGHGKIQEGKNFDNRINVSKGFREGSYSPSFDLTSNLIQSKEKPFIPNFNEQTSSYSTKQVTSNSTEQSRAHSGLYNVHSFDKEQTRSRSKSNTTTPVNNERKNHYTRNETHSFSMSRSRSNYNENSRSRSRSTSHHTPEPVSTSPQNKWSDERSGFSGFEPHKSSQMSDEELFLRLQNYHSSYAPPKKAMKQIHFTKTFLEEIADKLKHNEKLRKNFESIHNQGRNEPFRSSHVHKVLDPRVNLRTSEPGVTKDHLRKDVRPEVGMTSGSGITQAFQPQNHGYQHLQRPGFFSPQRPGMALPHTMALNTQMKSQEADKQIRPSLSGTGMVLGVGPSLASGHFPNSGPASGPGVMTPFIPKSAQFMGSAPASVAPFNPQFGLRPAYGAGLVQEFGVASQSRVMYPIAPQNNFLQPQVLKPMINPGFGTTTTTVYPGVYHTPSFSGNTDTSSSSSLFPILNYKNNSKQSLDITKASTVDNNEAGIAIQSDHIGMERHLQDDKETAAQFVEDERRRLLQPTHRDSDYKEAADVKLNSGRKDINILKEDAPLFVEDYYMQQSPPECNALDQESTTVEMVDKRGVRMTAKVRSLEKQRKLEIIQSSGKWNTKIAKQPILIQFKGDFSKPKCNSDLKDSTSNQSEVNFSDESQTAEMELQETPPPTPPPPSPPGISFTENLEAPPPPMISGNNEKSNKKNRKRRRRNRK